MTVMLSLSLFATVLFIVVLARALRVTPCSTFGHRWKPKRFPISSFERPGRFGLINRCTRCGIRGAYLGVTP